MSGDMAAAGGDATQQQKAAGGNRIQVSNSKKPLFFYVNLAKVSADPSDLRVHTAPSSPAAACPAGR